MALGDYEELENGTIAVTDLEFEESFKIKVDFVVKDVELASQRIYVLGKEKICQYDLKGVFAGETAAKATVKDIIEYNGCIVINSDSIEKVEKADVNKK
jgi:hypothetical protein